MPNTQLFITPFWGPVADAGGVPTPVESLIVGVQGPAGNPASVPSDVARQGQTNNFLTTQRITPPTDVDPGLIVGAAHNSSVAREVLRGETDAGPAVFGSVSVQQDGAEDSYLIFQAVGLNGRQVTVTLSSMGQFVSVAGAIYANTAAPGANTNQVATCAFVRNEIVALVNSSPAALDTLKELADALGDDPNFATTMTNALAAKAPLASPSFTGTVDVRGGANDPAKGFRLLRASDAVPIFVIYQSSGGEPVLDGQGLAVNFIASAFRFSGEAQFSGILTRAGGNGYLSFGSGGTNPAVSILSLGSTFPALALWRGGTAPILRFNDEGGGLLSSIDKNGAFSPPSLADASAVNGTVYFSTTANKLVYKDGVGAVNALY